MEHLAAGLPPAVIRAATAADVDELAAVAAATFPLACPAESDPGDVAAFVATHLSPQAFGDYLLDPDRIVLIACDADRILGYTMLIRGEPDDPDVQRAVPHRPTVELSKMYTAPEAHGRGIAAALMAHALGHCTDLGAACVWLGVNQDNARAQRFYAKSGFEVAGTKTFQLGNNIENDYVMVRRLSPTAPPP
ncbi:GNAT family N-acetyltransferase [Arthrobacter sp. SLBN-53]|uniref:GNAT family N-acetyltransferase n=1 Tax=Arthrobacter sp. SLBN-53 TaxID=2768412 RepID=UPI00114DFD92